MFNLRKARGCDPLPFKRPERQTSQHDIRTLPISPRSPVVDQRLLPREKNARILPPKLRIRLQSQRQTPMPAAIVARGAEQRAAISPRPWDVRIEVGIPNHQETMRARQTRQISRSCRSDHARRLRLAPRGTPIARLRQEPLPQIGPHHHKQRTIRSLRQAAFLETPTTRLEKPVRIAPTRSTIVGKRRVDRHLLILSRLQNGVARSNESTGRQSPQTIMSPSMVALGRRNANRLRPALPLVGRNTQPPSGRAELAVVNSTTAPAVQQGDTAVRQAR